MIDLSKKHPENKKMRFRKTLSETQEQKLFFEE